MAKYVCNGAMISCSFSLPVPLVPPLEPPKEPPGPNPCQVPLTVIRPNILVDKKPMANIMDFVPMMNIPTFGQCVAPTNPAVVSAGGFPVPCVPAVAAPWTPPKANVLVGKMPALLNTAMCICTVGSGQITIASAGQSDTAEG
ncbi:MAG: DUF4280 domain-containing protein [Tannerella sp.]|jgi:hypothetical protein|nr:DUF4280 domain-containing protein [Tannerella sp.]